MLRVIGDIHKARGLYRVFTDPESYGSDLSSIQVGDMDLDYEWMVESKIDPERHRFFTGNHDNMDRAALSPYNLGDYGTWSVPGFGDVFFIRGAWSIDNKSYYRHDVPKVIDGVLEEKNYWPETEELSLEQCNAAIALYEQVKPKFVLSHECPLDVVPEVTDADFTRNMGYSQPFIKTRTNQALSAMFSIHQPKVWCFGHYHRRKRFEHNNTQFFCVGLRTYVDFKEIPK